MSRNLQAPDFHAQCRHPPHPDDSGGFVGVDRGLAAFAVAATADGSEVRRFEAPKPLPRGSCACGGCGLAMDRDRNAATNLAVWAERHHAPAPDRQAGGRVTNAPGGEGAGHRPGDGGTDPSEGATDAHAVVA